MSIVQAHTLKDWPLALSVLEAMRRAGVEVAEGPGDAAQADAVIDALGCPQASAMFPAFADGYWRASEDFHHVGDTESERDGADMYRAVYRALEWALHQYDAHLETQYQAASAAKEAA